MSSTLFSGLILHGGKFGRIPVLQLTLDWTVSWHGLLSYWLLRATQDTALSLSLFISWPAFFGPHLYSLLGLLLCYATLPLYIRPLGKLWWAPTHPSITHKPSPESFAGTAQVANAHRPQRVVKVIPASASASTVCIGLSESASRGVCQPQPRLGLHIYRFIWTDGRVIPTGGYPWYGCSRPPRGVNHKVSSPNHNPFIHINEPKLQPSPPNMPAAQCKCQMPKTTRCSVEKSVLLANP